jgi:hypothetical protein
MAEHQPVVGEPHAICMEGFHYTRTPRGDV